MPYTAKREDVETIFEGGEYSMCGLLLNETRASAD
jgi:hypothetical protein